MNLLKTNTMEIKKSKFIAYLYLLEDLSDVKIILEDLHNKHKKARHIVYAYKFGSTAGKSDDKEPSGTAGTPLYNLLEMNNLNNQMLVVVRYFGGTKLGAGPLMRAYKNAGVSVIN
jgi:uncharacterized YigZ family protein